MATERRRAGDPRWLVQVEALIEQAGFTGGSSVGILRDLSRSGGRLHLSRAIALDAPVRLTLKLPHQTQICVMGRVAWVRAIEGALGWEVGIHFTEELPADMIEKIKRADGSGRWRGRGGRERRET